jgi:hypothetical protein
VEVEELVQLALFDAFIFIPLANALAIPRVL